MTTATEELEREKFIAWAKEAAFDIGIGSDGDFTDFQTDSAWQGWRARALMEAK